VVRRFLEKIQYICFPPSLFLSYSKSYSLSTLKGKSPLRGLEYTEASLFLKIERFLKNYKARGRKGEGGKEIIVKNPLLTLTIPHLLFYLKPQLSVNIKIRTSFGGLSR